MNINDFYKKISTIADSKISTLTMFFVFKDKSIKQANLKIDISEKLRVQFCKTLKEKINEKTEYKNINELDAAIIENKYLYFENKRIYGELEYLIKTDYNKVEVAKGLEENIFALLFKINFNEDSKDYITLYQQFYAINLLKKSRCFSLFQDGDILKEIPNNILTIYNHIDFIYDKDYFIVLNNSVLENKCGYKEVILQKAREVISNIKFIENIEFLEEDLKTNLRNAKKLYKSDETMLKMFDTEFNKVKEFIQNHKTLKRLQFKENKIELKHKKDIEALINLLSDSYLYSKLTNEDYVSNSKDRI